jgi:hypothetical protein
MSKRLHLLISFVSVLIWASISYGQADPRMIKLDINIATDNNEPNTQVGFTPFILADSGSEVNCVVIDLSGNLNSARRAVPSGVWAGDPLVYYPRAGERIYRDFIFGVQPSGINITLWGLGVNRDCNITIWAYDACSIDANRIANWYGNDTYLFETNFIGGSATWPSWEIIHPEDLYKHAYHHNVTTDYLGRIILTSYRNPLSPASQPFAFVDGLQVEPLGTFSETKYAQRPVPFDGTSDVDVNTKLKWRKGEGVSKHDLYLGTDETAVTNATRSSHPGVLATLDLAFDANHGYDPYGATGFLKLEKNYYWRVDENSTGGPWQGEVWSFKTLPYSVVDDFESYVDNNAIKSVWKDYWDNVTSAEVFLETTIVHSGRQSMMYQYENYSYCPYYSEANATIAALGIDPNWLGMGAKALSLWFYGDRFNPISAHDDMYIKLVDSDTPVHTATVVYSSYGNITDLREEGWQEWNIPLADFSGVNMRKVKNIIIGFGDGTQAVSDGVVYFDDIRLYATRCILSERDPDFAPVDFAPLDANGYPIGDCIVDYKELLIMADTWLVGDEVFPTKNPNDVNLVLYYPMNEGYGNKIYPDPCDPNWIGTLYGGVSWAPPGAQSIGSPYCLYFDGDYGGKVQCGTYGKAGLGIGPTPPDINAMTLSLWTKWMGPRYWDSYLLGKSQGLLGKRGGWSDTTMVWMFEVGPGYYPELALRYYGEPPIYFPVYSPPGILNPYIGSWVHIAATFDGNTAKIYINNSEVASGKWRFSHGPDPNIFLTIGCTMDINAWPNSCPESFYGYIDEVRIYDRALEPNEILYLADTTPEDGYFQIPVPSAAEIYAKEPLGEQLVNFKDFALVANKWLEEDMFP